MSETCNGCNETIEAGKLYCRDKTCALLRNQAIEYAARRHELGTRLAEALDVRVYRNNRHVCGRSASLGSHVVTAFVRATETTAKLDLDLPGELALEICRLISAYIDESDRRWVEEQKAHTRANCDTKVVPGQGTHV